MTDEQRTYYRIDDRLKLGWRRVLPGEHPNDAHFDQEIRDLNDQLNTLVTLAFQESAAIGEALGLLNRKLDLLATKEVEQDVPLATTRVNLSGAGIGFACDQSVQRGEVIDITLVLEPSNVSVNLRSDVINCEDSNRDGETYWIRAAFEDGQDLAIEQIVQHVAHRQTEQLAARHRMEELDSAMYEYEDEDEDD